MARLLVFVALSAFLMGVLILTLTFVFLRRESMIRAAIDTARQCWIRLEKLVIARADPKEQFAVVLELRRLGRPAIPFLVEQWTQNPNAHLADQAWSALWGIASPKTPELIPALIDKLSNHNSRIRYQAIRILEQIGTKARAAVPDLRRIMDEDEDAQAQSAAILALKAITGIRA